MLLVTNLEDASDPSGTLTRVSEATAATEGVALVAAPVANPMGDTAIITLVPRTKPQDEATSKLVNHLRDSVLPATLDGTGTRVLVGGFTAIAQLDRFVEAGGNLVERTSRRRKVDGTNA